MKKEFLDVIKKLYGDDSKVIVTDSKLATVYSSCPSLVENVTADMFCRSSIAPMDNQGIFPIKEKTVLSLVLGGMFYAATVTPFCDGEETYYRIELTDNMDYIRLSGGLRTYLSEMINVSEMRKAVAGIYAGKLLAEQETGEPDGVTGKLSDKGCNAILRAIVNKEELLCYTTSEPECKTVDLGALTQDICRLCTLKLSFATGRNWQVTCDVQQGCTAVCKGERFAAVLLNLIENALIYNISEDKQVHVTAENRHGEVRVSVTDNGVGMSLDAIEKAFTPYALCQPGETHGCLGLPLANVFCKTYGGSAGILSHVDEGTTVTLRLPYSDEPVNDCFSPREVYSGDRFSQLSIYLSRIIDRENM